MSKNRIKSKNPIQDIFAAETAMGEIRRLTLERNALITGRDQALKEIDDIYGPQFLEYESKLTTIANQLEAWSNENEDAFDGKSLTFCHGKMGWRLGQWQCSKLKGWIWERTKKSAKAARVILEQLKEMFGTQYVRVKEEVDKDALIADRGTLTADQLQSVGVKLHQEETFYVEPNVEEVENRQVAS